METPVHYLFIKHWKPRIYYLSLLMLLFSSFSAAAGVCFHIKCHHLLTIKQAEITSISSSTATPVSFHKDADDNDPSDKRVDFQVQSVSRHRFRISFNNKSGNSVFVKIYDVIGNLIRQEKIDRKGKFKKEYDLSNAPTDFYVIEVGNTEASTIKRLFPN
jgi:hypothetical protein